MYAEKIKIQHASANGGEPMSTRIRIMLDVIVPSISITLLLSVTIFIAYDALRILLHPPAKDDVAVSYLYTFATLNIIIDLVCGFLFYAKGLGVFREIDSNRAPSTYLHGFDDKFALTIDPEEEERTLYMDNLEEEGKGGGGNDNGGHQHYSSPSSSSSSSSHEQGGGEGNRRHKTNLNVLTAFAHLGGDTLRSLSVFLAALVSSFSGIDADICDAWAALVVAITILALAVPIVKRDRPFTIL